MAKEPDAKAPSKKGKELALYESADKFIFEVPLYEPVRITSDQTRALFLEDVRIDGHCPHCRQLRTFNRTSGEWHYATLQQNEMDDYTRFGELNFTCTRYDKHKLRFWYLYHNETIEKVGQFPSFADIALDISKQYTKQLSKEDAGELHKAIGLAAHGVGIGAYVYMRRIFERLIRARFNSLKDANGWSEEEFNKLRMAEKVDFLKDHLPAFLVKNKKVYSILSLGLHQLDEVTCLAFFEVLKAAIIIMLEEDKKRQEEQERTQALEKAIASFDPAKPAGAS